MDENESTLEAEAEPTGATAAAPPADDVIEDELLIEEVSIDGMCGVY
jgi:mycofactocin precursor